VNGNGFVLATAPMLPWPGIAALGAAGALILGFGAWRRARGLGWRAIAIAILLTALVDPSLIVEQRAAQHDVAVVVVDESPSQSIGDRRQATETALTAVSRGLAGEPDLDVRVIRAGLARPGAGDDGTRLFAALSRATAQIPQQRLAGVVMITDGEVHDVPEGDAPQLAKAIGAPLHVLLSGRPDERDRRLVVVRAPRFGLVGNPAPLTIRIEDLPEKAGEKVGAEPAQAVATWRKDADAPQQIAVPVGHDVSFAVPIDHGGPNVIELATAPGPHPLTLVNKRAVVVVNGVRDHLRVLLVSGEPHAGERVWRNLLKADPSVDLVHFTILRPPEKQDGTPIKELSLIAFPIRELFDTKLADFDLIVFDRYSRRGVIPETYLENIVHYVENGGALLDAEGPSSENSLSLDRTALAQILPAVPTGTVYDEGFKPQLTALGRRDPVTEGLPGAGAPGGEPSWGRWFRQIGAQVRSGVMVMTGDHGDPLLVLDRVGKGRVAQLLSDEMWFWARGFEGGGPQGELLRRLAYWLMKEPDLEENDLRATVDGDRLVVTRQSLEPDALPVTVTTPDGTKQSLSLSPQGGGRSTGSMAISAMGLYRVTEGARMALAAAGPLNPFEFADVRATPDKLEPVVRATGGGIFWIGSGKVPEIRRIEPGRTAAGRNWMGFRKNGEYTVTGFSETPLLPAAAALLLIVGGLLAAWRREGS
jgi:hypothetical protein